MSTDVGGATSTETTELSTIDMGLEVVTVPVSMSIGQSASIRASGGGWTSTWTAATSG